MISQNGDQLVSLSKASQKTNYSEGHLNLLCRLGKLECQKLGRNWYTSEQALWRYTTKRSNGGRVPTAARLAAFYQGLGLFTKITLLASALLIALHGVQTFKPRIATIGEDGMEVKELTISPLQGFGNFLSNVAERGRVAQQRLIAEVAERQSPAPQASSATSTSPAETQKDNYFSTLETDGEDLILAPSKGNDVVVKSDLFVSGKLVGVVVDEAMLANQAVSSAKIADGTISAVDIASGAVTGRAIKDDTITTLDLIDGAVTADKLADGTINSTKIADGTIGSVDLANNIITSDMLRDSAVTGAKIAANTVTGADLATTLTLSDGDCP